MSTTKRVIAREIVHKHLDAGDPLGWFEDLYSLANEDSSIIPWADLEPNPSLVDWLNQHAKDHCGLAIKVGSGLGDDAEELARRGFKTTAFDISESAIDWSRKRFPKSSVSYVAADLFSATIEWKAGFDFVLESYTLQVLPSNLRKKAARCITSFTICSAVPIGPEIARVKRWRNQSQIRYVSVYWTVKIRLDSPASLLIL